MEKNKNSFLITCVSCIVVLLLMCYFGINTSLKSTHAVGTYTCPSGKDLVSEKWCCPSSGNYVAAQSIGGIEGYFCVQNEVTLHYGTIDNKNIPYCSITLSDQAACSAMGDGWTVDGNPTTSGVYCVNTTLSSCAPMATEASLSTTTTVNILYSVPTPWFNQQYTDTVDSNSKFTVRSFNPFETVDNGKYSECQLHSWNTNSDLSGTKYEIGEEYTIGSSNLILYPEYVCPVDLVLDAENGEVYSFVNQQKAVHGKTYTTTLILGSRASSGNLGEYYAELSGYTFEGWDTTTNCTNPQSSSSYTLNLSQFPTKTNLYACYTENSSDPSDEPSIPTTKTFNATFKDYDGSELSRTSCTTNGTNTYCQVSAPATNPSRTGYTFNGWSWGGNDCSRIWHSTMTISGDLSFYACYTENANRVDTEPEKPEIDDQKPETNVDENPQTGSIVIFIVWVIGLAAIVYSVWYFNKFRKN